MVVRVPMCRNSWLVARGIGGDDIDCRISIQHALSISPVG